MDTDSLQKQISGYGKMAGQRANVVQGQVALAAQDHRSERPVDSEQFRQADGAHIVCLEHFFNASKPETFGAGTRSFS